MGDLDKEVFEGRPTTMSSFCSGRLLTPSGDESFRELLPYFPHSMTCAEKLQIGAAIHVELDDFTQGHEFLHVFSLMRVTNLGKFFHLGYEVGGDFSVGSEFFLEIFPNFG